MFVMNVGFGFEELILFFVVVVLNMLYSRNELVRFKLWDDYEVIFVFFCCLEVRWGLRYLFVYFFVNGRRGEFVRVKIDNEEYFSRVRILGFKRLFVEGWEN